MRRSKVIRSTAPEISSATETCGPVSPSVASADAHSAVPPALFVAPVKRKRAQHNRLALAASPSPFNQPGQLDHAHVSSTPCDLPPLSLEGLMSQRQQRIEQQRIEEESIQADLSKRMATGVNPNPLLRKLYLGSGGGTGNSSGIGDSSSRSAVDSACHVDSNSSDGNSSDGLRGEGDSHGGLRGDGGDGVSSSTRGGGRSSGTSAEGRSCEDADSAGAGKRRRTESASAAEPSDPANSQVLNTVDDDAIMIKGCSIQHRSPPPQPTQPPPPPPPRRVRVGRSHRWRHWTACLRS